MGNHIERYLVKPDSKVHLKSIDPADDGGLDKATATVEFEQLKERLGELQNTLYAEARRSLLVVLQAMDTGGKDSLIRSVFTGFNPAGCVVHSFKAPTAEELAHDFLWRVHACAPRRGHVGVFNRSHYEDVLIVRVKSLVPDEVWRERYEHINRFERLLADEGTTVVKFFLHISKDYQKERLQKRLDDPAKHWKFEPGDLVERKRWDDYQKAYDDVLEKCSTDHAPWYIIPGEKRWYRDLLVAKILVKTLDKMDLKYPDPKFDPAAIVIE